MIRAAGPDDAPVVVAVLSSLAHEIGDGARFRSTESLIRRHGFGPGRLFHSMLAFADAAPVGLALYFPTFSTTRGAPGLYIQDLYVAEAARGGGLGRRLLQAAARHAGTAWEATHLTLTVYDDNAAARDFYQRLGFVLRRGEIPASLDEPSFSRLLQWP